MDLAYPKGGKIGALLAWMFPLSWVAPGPNQGIPLGGRLPWRALHREPLQLRAQLLEAKKGLGPARCPRRGDPAGPRPLLSEG